MNCPDCRRPAYRVGPFFICRNLWCDRLVAGWVQ